VTGVKVPPPLLALGTLALAAAGFRCPASVAHTEAAKLREQIRYATSALLDLVAVMLAAGAGQEEAFTLAASTGTGPDTTSCAQPSPPPAPPTPPSGTRCRTRPTHRGARTDRTRRHLAPSPGTEGARIRATLTTKAASLRARLLAAAEAKAASATERMGLPTVLLMAGFLIFTCYPALAQVMKSL
jgi:tight adherence protein C